MRLYEIASAEEQITLFKLITDKVWQSLADQKKQQDEQAAHQRRQAAMSGGGRARRDSTKPKPIKPIKPVKPIKPAPLAPQPAPQPIPPQSAQPTTPMSFANDKSRQTMPKQSLELADQRVAHYPQQRQQSAILPIRLR